MATPGQQMFRIICEPNVFSTPPTKEIYDKWYGDFMQCLEILDQRLVETPFLCGSQITLGDIIVFCEIDTFFELNKLTD